MNTLVIPDLRYEQSFWRTLNANSVRTSSAKPQVTAKVVAYTIAIDHVLKPFIQGFLWAELLYILRPALRKIFTSGRNAGIRIFGSLGLARPSTINYKLR
ncbi:BA75_02946T0 [Komagataella pastoris]|uniref:BA75_02946T0 n=1 Tax=Komagataella pastoris TaxID=4922 RepID=A0A1B2JD25_PICPA|nr:BA75_02946T0 [Komagataella pastoris]